MIGLDQSYEFVQTRHRVDKNAPPAGGFRNAPPLADELGTATIAVRLPAGFNGVALASVPWTVKGYTPQQIKGACGISGYDGEGQTVAVIDAYASPTILQDVNQWSGESRPADDESLQLVQIVPPRTYKRPQNPQHDPQGWYGEETLDIEAVHGMAPAAKIVYVGAPNNRQDLDAALNHVVDKGLAQIVTNSYGFSTTEYLPPGYVKPLEDTLIRAAIQGIGVYFSSGDDGDETINFGFATDRLAGVEPVGDGWVGGTSFLRHRHGNNRVIETGWGTSNYNCNSTTLVRTRMEWLYGAGRWRQRSVSAARLSARGWTQSTRSRRA